VKLPHRRQFLHLAAGAAALSAAPRIAKAQAYPRRPITIVVGFAPGASNDVAARLLSEGMRGTLGQTVIIENVTGANGSIAAGRVARATPDGYTLIVGSWNNFVGNGALYTLQYDLRSDFRPIALLSEAPILIATRKGLPANDLGQLITWLKSHPDKATDGHSGVGSIGHIVGALFQKETGTRFALVPYRGGSPAVQDLVAGQIDLVMNAASDALTQVLAGSVKCLAVAAKRRLSALPEVPTVDEAGLPGFYFSQWFGLWAPKGTPNDVIGKINVAVVKALADPSMPARLAEVGQEIFPPNQQTPESLSALHSSEIEKWWPIIKAAGIKGE